MLGVLEILPLKNSTAEEEEQEKGLFFYQGKSVIRRQSAKQLPQKWGDSGLTCFFPCLGRPRRLSTSFSSLIRKDTN
jgi:hypothetical protein